MITHSYVKLGEEFRIALGKQKSQVRSWEKTCGLEPTKKKTPLKRIVEEIDDAPEQLKYLNDAPVRFGEREMKAGMNNSEMMGSEE